MRAPHPGFRRLFKLGGTIVRAAQRLGETPAALPRLTRMRLDSALLGDDAVRALTSPPDLAALFAQVLPAGPAEPLSRAAAQPGDPASRTTAGTHARDSSDTLSGLRARAPRTPAASSPALPGEGKARRDHIPAVADQSDAYASGPARVPSAAGETSGSRPRTRRALPSRVSLGHQGGSNQPDRPEIADVDAHRAAARARRVLSRMAERLSAAGTRDMHPDASVLFDRSMATAQLRSRAARAGAPSSADTRLFAHTATEQVAALLSGVVAPSEQGAGTGPLTPHSLIHGEAKRGMGAASALPVLVRVLERIPTDAPAGNRATRAGSARAASAPPQLPQRDAGSAFSRIPPAEPTSGLRRLLALHEGSQPDAPQSNGPRELDRTPESGVVAARLRDAQLAESLDRLLRREARRDGIDVEGLSG